MNGCTGNDIHRTGTDTTRGHSVTHINKQQNLASKIVEGVAEDASTPPTRLHPVFT